MIKIRYFYSACVGIETAESSILCDPWFTDGAYDGSWYLYPKFENPIEALPRYDYIYVSHIHPDHYDATFLRQYLAKHTSTKVVIADFQHNFLSGKMRADGIPHVVRREFEEGSTKFALIPNHGSSYDVDSALIVKRKDHSVVNMNDNLYNQAQISAILAYCGNPTIALLGYTGAGPYPQTYYTDRTVLMQKAQQKRADFFGRYNKIAEALNPKRIIPFAGKYILGGKLAHLNEHRGVADAVEVLDFDPRAVVLADGGKGVIDTETLQPSATRTEKYDLERLRAYCQEISTRPMLYEVYFKDLRPEVIPFKRLLPKAYATAATRTTCLQDYYFCVQQGNGWFVMNARKEANECSFVDDVSSLQPRSEIKIDARYLFGLITCVFHWNNAEVGSQYMTTRVPDVFNREAQSFLNFFHL